MEDYCEMTNNVILWRAIAFPVYVTAWWGLEIKTPEAEADFLIQRVILTIKYGATDIGDLVQAVSALANPNLKRNTITWQGRKAHASGALTERGATSSDLAALPYLDRKTTIMKRPKQWRVDRFSCQCYSLVGYGG